ncbi:Capsule polysaccharide biosynthesis protein [Lutimaribacter pacificus]|uniref:Capsule polysaccharide biosynthesis protein n=1 Tax=Lutimaribacter pacificus TaxID=391948 RepID=A0A1H0JEQ5_9RHOB|nr:hypothetical protein [Lutimaribacter pacificus]SDO42237.1 Capsule polysaccharide biosynthesis protein [Lutimaribacter pacificus]SHK10924.1 Capsule polysaccharide biosynthesis protein [Lutimaribacter pacificus]
MAAMSEIVFHLPRDWVADPSAMLPFYRKLTAGLSEAGIGWRAVPIDRNALPGKIDDDDAFHIVNHGQLRHPRVLNAGIAYIYPFWNLDPQGIRAFSSIADKSFRPARVDADKAQAFFRRLRARLVEARVSRYEQPQEPGALPDAQAAVFFQSETHRIVGETCYMDRWTMLQTVLDATNGTVIVKPHPRELDSAVYDRLIALRDAHPRLQISTGNIHDIIAASDRVVTINSAVGVEAYLHRKPVILCGKTDFHHIATTAQDPAALAAALAAPAPARQYAKYVYWYFGLNCVNAGADALTGQVLRRVRATGHAI